MTNLAKPSIAGCTSQGYATASKDAHRHNKIWYPGQKFQLLPFVDGSIHTLCMIICEASALQLSILLAQAAAASAQHSQEVASLQAQLSALQHEKRQLLGRSAQHSRDAKHAAAAAQESQGLLERTKQQLQKVSKQLEAKEATLSR